VRLHRLRCRCAVTQTSPGIALQAALLRRAKELHDDPGPAFDELYAAEPCSCLKLACNSCATVHESRCCECASRTQCVALLAADADIHRTCNNLFAT